MRSDTSSASQPTPESAPPATAHTERDRRPTAGQRLRRGMLGSNIGPLIGAQLLLMLFFATRSEFFFTSDNAINIGRQMALVCIIALGVTVVLIAGEIDISMAGVMAITSVATGIVLRRGGDAATPISRVLLALLAGLAIGLSFGLFNGVVTVYGKAPSFLVTLGSLSVASGLALSYNKSESVPIGADRFVHTFSTKEIAGIPVLILYAAVVFVLVLALMRGTLFGIQAYATGGNRESARLAGIPVRRVRISALALCGTVAGFAGVIGTARYSSALPNISPGIELDAIAAAVLGGTRLSGGFGTPIGTLMGAVLIATVGNGLTLLEVRSPIQQVIKGFVIIAAVTADGLRARRV
ncbi:MAG: ABC transporter permease [Vicinamibacterales bacterium]